MRKIIVGLHITFDGILSGPQGDEDNFVRWGMPGVQDSTPDFQEFFSDLDGIILGRVTYDGLRHYWPTASGDFADAMNQTQKYVLSTTLDTVEWGAYDTIALIREDVEAEVQKLKEQPGKDIIVFASSKVVQSLTNAGLVDEYRIVVHPIILGSGVRLFEDIQNQRRLTLKNITPYPSGAVLIHYTVATE